MCFEEKTITSLSVFFFFLFSCQNCLFLGHRYKDTRFDIAAAGCLALTALNSIENAITYLGICFRWCQETQQPFHTFQFFSLCQLSEATLNVFWAMEGSYKFRPDCENDPCVRELFAKQTHQGIHHNTIRISSLKPNQNTAKKDSNVTFFRSKSQQKVGDGRVAPGLTRRSSRGSRSSRVRF